MSEKQTKEQSVVNAKKKKYSKINTSKNVTNHRAVMDALHVYHVHFANVSPAGDQMSINWADALWSVL